MNVQQIREALAVFPGATEVVVGIDEDTLDEYPETILEGMDLRVRAIEPGPSDGTVTVWLTGFAEDDDAGSAP